ncbi:FAD:protein FMN transferase [Dactylosporangium siamense]|uniref:FAD:protein FMN transferase n=1 Tax=Dactylosporangium siamense TaxID=685454 RepID=A0A919U8F0_9ACTN|nr:FAD:protein FMN transferase [Dactylosporangium siamense]GIG42071.1 FAD:protein FMN transferase [Dactylosporangium siamense]
MAALEHGAAQWETWSTTVRLVVTDPAALPEAEELVRAELAAVDLACSRFRDDSELHHVHQTAGRPVEVSELLAELVAVALRAARDTGGDVDPTVGAAIADLGYDRDFAEIDAPAGNSGTRLIVYPTANWRHVRLRGRRLTVPPGVTLDLGATAKAWAADRCARLVAAATGAGVLVSLGGDIATAGPAPAGGWRVLVQDRPGEPGCTVRLPGGAALASSSTISRQWLGPHGVLHHILDPRTGMPAPRVWRTVSVAARSCVHANTLSTAAVVRGRAAHGWLARQGAPARLVSQRRQVYATTGWPL